MSNPPSSKNAIKMYPVPTSNKKGSIRPTRSAATAAASHGYRAQKTHPLQSRYCLRTAFRSAFKYIRYCSWYQNSPKKETKGNARAHRTQGQQRGNSLADQFVPGQFGRGVWRKLTPKLKFVSTQFTFVLARVPQPLNKAFFVHEFYAPGALTRHSQGRFLSMANAAYTSLSLVHNDSLCVRPVNSSLQLALTARELAKHREVLWHLCLCAHHSSFVHFVAKIAISSNFTSITSFKPN